MFKYTTTIGVRQYNCDRYILSRKTENIETDYGNVRVKKTSGYGVEREKWSMMTYRILQISGKNRCLR